MFSVDQHDWLVLWQQSNPNTVLCKPWFLQEAANTLLPEGNFSFVNVGSAGFLRQTLSPCISGTSSSASPRSVPVCWQRSVALWQYQKQRRDFKNDGEVRFVCVALFLFIWELFVVVGEFCLVFLICLFGVCLFCFERAAALSWFPTEKQVPTARMLWMTTRKPELGTSVSLIDYQLLKVEEVETWILLLMPFLVKSLVSPETLISNTEPIRTECRLQLDDILHTFRASRKMFSN